MGCNDGYGSDKHIRFVENQVVVTKGSNILFSSSIFELSSWFHQIDDYSFDSYELSQDEWVQSEIGNDDFDFVLILVEWPDGIAKADKMLELFLPDAQHRTSFSIPTVLGNGEEAYFKVPLKDMFLWDSVIGNRSIYINNISPKDATVNILMAK